MILTGFLRTNNTLDTFLNKLDTIQGIFFDTIWHKITSK